MGHTEKVGCEGVEWISMAQASTSWPALVKEVMKFQDFMYRKIHIQNFQKYLRHCYFPVWFSMQLVGWLDVWLVGYLVGQLGSYLVTQFGSYLVSYLFSYLVS